MPQPEPPTLLRGYNVVSLAPNLPGPIAARRLADMGAFVTKVEGPNGDLLAHAAPEYYEWLRDRQQIVQLNLKEEPGREKLHELLSDCDVLITSSRPAALARLGLSWGELNEAYPQLCQVAIVGHSGQDANLAGHDLTYQAHAGTLVPPAMPAVPVADLAGAEMAVQAALALLLDRDGARHNEVSRQAWKGGTNGGYHEVALADAAEAFGMPAQYGLTAQGGPLGGATPAYKIYEAAPVGGTESGVESGVASGVESLPTRSFVAFAALEPHFLNRAVELLGVDGSEEQFAEAFKAKTAAQWEEWGTDNDVPIAEVRVAGQDELRDQ